MGCFWFHIFVIAGSETTWQSRTMLAMTNGSRVGRFWFGRLEIADFYLLLVMPLPSRSIDNQLAKICVFTGAGIGVPLKLPTTTEFDAVLSEIPVGILKYMNLFLGDSKNDIEKVLYLLEELVNPTAFIFSYLQYRASEDGHVNATYNQVAGLKQQASSAILNIKSALFDILEKYKIEDAFFLYSNILKEIKSHFNRSAISIFTTNYDLTFENGVYSQKKSIEDLGIVEIDYGFKFEFGKLLFDSESRFTWQENIIEYLKLHGSLDWNMDINNACIRSGASIKPAKPDDMPLLYPGYKGTPSKEPFVSIHERLYSRLIDADYVFVLGFAFRDPYINNIFEFALRGNKKIKIFIYNPSETKNLPAESALHSFVHRFKNLQHIVKGIELIENPLDLDNLLKR
jgi:hypothetical protein